MECLKSIFYLSSYFFIDAHSLNITNYVPKWPVIDIFLLILHRLSIGRTYAYAHNLGNQMVKVA